jgi:hypothetical protein
MIRLAAGMLAVLAMAVSLLSAPVAAADPTADDLTTLASQYLRRFVERFSHVVAEERYVQDWRTDGGLQLLHRESRGDFLLARSSDAVAWQAFRDVFEVDGAPVRDRQDRLTALFVTPTGDAMAQATAIARESDRYNISNVRRSVNNPLFALAFLQPSIQRRFAFTVSGQDKAFGGGVWLLDYRESVRPTLIRGTGDGDLPAHGRFWIDAATGAIRQTELQLEDSLQTAHITARFQRDDRFTIEVPVAMDEQYTVKGNGGKVSARATYGRFRQFEVDTDEQAR